MCKRTTRPTHPRHHRAMVATLALCAVLSLQGCATRTQPAVDAELPDLARFYWPYAALATDVYRTAGKIQDEIVLAGASPWLRRELGQAARAQGPAADGAAESRLGDLLGAYRRYATRRCGLAGVDSQAGATGADLQDDCLVSGTDGSEGAAATDDLLAETNRSIDRTPMQDLDCDDRGGRQPLVPVAMAMQRYGWERAPEFQRHAVPRGWRLFVPELAVDVWRRPLPSQGASPAMEYAIVYRGTVGGGGWLSNLRALTAITPLIWDQYRQAEGTTRMIIRQIQRMHALSDALLQREAGTQLHITAVGHSLGAGLANHKFLCVAKAWISAAATCSASTTWPAWPACCS